MPINDPATQSTFQRVRAELSAKPLGRGTINSVIVRNPLRNADSTPNVIEVWVGDGGSQMWDLLPGAQTPEIFAEDLKDIYVRVILAVGEVITTDVIVLVHRYAEPVRDLTRKQRYS